MVNAMGVMLPQWLCLFVGAILLLRPDVCYAKLHGNDINVYEEDLSDETHRVRLFKERHGTWPDPKWLEWEKPGYGEMMEQKARAAMAITDRTQRWLAWRELTQARMVPRFTENQWEAVDAPEHIHRRLLENFHRLLPEAGSEADMKAIQGGIPKFLPQESLNYEILHEMTPFFEEWAGMKLEPTSVYGVRLYQEGNTLDDHLDIIETHVISGILHIDSDLDEPFPIQIDNSDGTLASMNLKPGQVMFYESAKSFHQRKVPMKGRYYGSIFMHYRPVGWNITRRDVKIAVPPFWSDGLEDPEIMASIENNSDSPVVINWVIPGSETSSADGQPQMTPLETVQPGKTTEIKTAAGHTLFATRPDGSFTRWVVEPKHRSKILRVVEETHHGHEEL